MRYIDNPELFSVEEMLENDTEAYAAAEAAYAAYAAADAADAYAADAYAYAADDAYPANAYAVRYSVNEYFKFTDENAQDYTNEVERLK